MTTQGLPAAVARHLPRLALYAPLRNSSLGRLSPSSSLSKEESILEFCQSLQHQHLTAEDGESLLSGVEASLEDLGVDGTQQTESAQLIRAHGLDLLIHMNIDAHGSRNSNSNNNNNHGLAWAAVQSFGSQLDQISNLGTVVSHVNCRGFGMTPAPSSGNIGSRSDNSRRRRRGCSWNPETTLDYLLEVLPLSAEFLEDHPHIGRNGNETDVMGGAPDHLTGISHETTQGSMFHRLQPTLDLLEVVPPLRLTMELTTWQQQQHLHMSAKAKDSVHGNLPDEGDILSEEIVPHIDWIRTKASLLPLANHHNSNTFQDSQHLGRHQALWDCVWTRKAKRGVTNVFMTLDDGDAHADGESTGNSTMVRAEDEKECSVRVQRLAQSANCIHKNYHHWSGRQAWETSLHETNNMPRQSFQPVSLQPKTSSI